jgi:signal transduction histidine kinase
MNSDSKKRILIVDDESLAIKVLALMLEPDYITIAAVNGDEALAAARADPPPDIVLLDVMMSDMDGYEVCRQLKAEPETADIPVIFVTALDQRGNEAYGFEVGAVDYITKPIAEEIVRARVRTHLALVASLRELKKNQKTIQSRNAELDEMNQLKNKFIGMAAHDLRNPIVSILGFTDVLLSDDELEAEDSKRYLEIISAACKKMLDLISDTLEVSVIESGELLLNPGFGSLAELVIERLQILDPIAARKNIEIVKNFDTVENSWFDPSRVAQVIDNLISNAIKFSPHDKKIFVSLDETDDDVTISIKDQGPGIAAEDQHRMFDHFQKLRNKPTDGESSTGLGLAIAKKIVDVHGGRINVESKAGDGATFSFSLPRDNFQD